MTATMPQVLVVEDNPYSCAGVAELLRRRGYDVHTAGDGQTAAQYLRTHSPAPDVILLDMLMPVMDGWHFLNELKTLQLQPRPWVILTTGSPSIGREWAADHGCGGYLHKPFDEQDLLQEIQRCLQQTTEQEF